MNIGKAAYKAFWRNVEATAVKWKELEPEAQQQWREAAYASIQEFENEPAYEMDDVTLALRTYVCGNCSYYYIDRCHKDPPVHGFPYVRDDDWCGEFNFKQ
jgi:hypothetical protein